MYLQFMYKKWIHNTSYSCIWIYFNKRRYTRIQIWKYHELFLINHLLSFKQTQISPFLEELIFMHNDDVFVRLLCFLVDKSASEKWNSIHQLISEWQNSIYWPSKEICSFNLCWSIKLNSFSCSFSSISFLNYLHVLWNLLKLTTFGTKKSARFQRYRFEEVPEIDVSVPHTDTGSIRYWSRKG